MAEPGFMPCRSVSPAWQAATEEVFSSACLALGTGLLPLLEAGRRAIPDTVSYRGWAVGEPHSSGEEPRGSGLHVERPGPEHISTCLGLARGLEEPSPNR